MVFFPTSGSMIVSPLSSRLLTRTPVLMHDACFAAVEFVLDGAVDGVTDPAVRMEAAQFAALDVEQVALQIREGVDGVGAVLDGAQARGVAAAQVA
jgi:hypothetical protein